MIDRKDKMTYLMSIKGDTITASDIYNLFNKKTSIRPDGVKVVEYPLFEPEEEIVVPKGSLKNITEDTKTTAGRYIFNMVVIESAFGDKWPYINYTLRGDQVDDLKNKMCDELLMGRITGEEYAKFQRNVVWLNNFTEIFVPGISINLIMLPKEIKNELQRLIDANKQAIITNDVVTYIKNVEKPILDFARKWYIEHDEPGWALYAKGGKPKFDNVFKNMFLEVGPILDIATGKYKISTGCYADGIPSDEYYLYANQGIFGAYNRAVNTQYSGAKTKEFAVAFQSLQVIEEDCGTQHTIGLDVTKSNLSSIKWRWIKDTGVPEGWTVVTPDNLESYIGKHVEYRSPMFCMSKHLCWRCMGELYRRMNLKNAGLASQKLTSIFMNKSLKAMHDTTSKISRFDWQKCLYDIK